MERTEKLQKFQSTIMAEVAQRCDEIDHELEEYRKMQLENAENAVLEESYRLIQKEVAEVTAQATRELSRKRIEMKRQLYVHRDECAADVFKEARALLTEFVLSAQYRPFLLEKTRLLGKMGADGTVLYVREGDLALANELKLAYGHACEVRVLGTIALGGVVAENEGLSSIADESLDAALEAQHAWLCSQADFVVSM